MQRELIPRPLTFLLALIGLIWLLSWLFSLANFFGDIILLFFLAWLVAFTLSPLVGAITAFAVPNGVVEALRQRGYRRVATVLGWVRVGRGLAVSLLYLGVVFVVIVGGIFLLPIVTDQSIQLASRIPDYAAQAPLLLQTVQDELARRGLPIQTSDLATVTQYREWVQDARNIATVLAQNAVGLLTSLATLVANLFLVLILSFYMMLDGPRLLQGILALVPPALQDDARYFFASVDRTFGGFLRGQVIAAVLAGLGTMIVMQLSGLGFVLVIGVTSAIMMLIPLVGAPLAVILPTFIALVQGQPGTALTVFLVLFVFQQLLFNAVIPRIIGEALGMHPLLVLAALLIGIRVAGFWGALFGIPVVGVLATMASFAYNQIREQYLEPGNNAPSREA